jgi:hypothetical protein
LMNRWAGLTALEFAAERCTGHERERRRLQPGR